METTEWTPGAPPLTGIGPREGLPPGHLWPSRRGDPDGPGHGRVDPTEWVRVGWGLYRPASLEGESTTQRVVEGAASLTTYGAVTGWASLAWRRATWFDGTGRGGIGLRPVPLIVGPGHGARGQGERILVSQDSVMPADIERIGGLRMTLPAFSVAFEMCRARDADEAARICTMAAYDDLVSIAEMRDHLEHRLRACTGIGLVREGLPLAVENCWSPMEFEMMRVWQQVHAGPLLCNTPIFTLTGRHIGTPDLFDPDAGVPGDYDGALHLTGKRRAEDIRRDAAFRAVDLDPVTMVAADRDRLGGFVTRLDQAYARAARRPHADRRWTLEQPSWWVDTSTVERRRALTERQRERMLGYRRLAA